MRNTTSRALRATATVAGVAALGAAFTGTAFADSGLGGLGGSDSGSGFGDSSDSHGLSNLGNSDSDSSGSTVFDNGLGNFEMPGMGVGSRGMRTSGSDGIPLLDALDGGDNDSDEGNMPQHPVDNENGNFAKNISFLGHDSNASYGGGKSIGSRSFRTSGSDDFGGGSLLGGDSDSGSGDSDYGSKLYNHGGSSSRTGGDDSDFGGSDGDGLSGHTIKLPLGT